MQTNSSKDVDGGRDANGANPAPHSHTSSHENGFKPGAALAAGGTAVSGTVQPTEHVKEFMRRIAPIKCPTEDEEIPALSAVLCSVMVLNSVVERNGNRIIEEHGLTMPQWMALGAISHAGEEGLPHSQLGQRLMLSKAPITGIVDRLERGGFVVRKADAKDRRVSRVVATPEGVQKWWSVKEGLRSRTEAICGDCLSEQEKLKLLELLGRLLESLSANDLTLNDHDRDMVNPKIPAVNSH